MSPVQIQMLGLMPNKQSKGHAYSLTTYAVQLLSFPKASSSPPSASLHTLDHACLLSPTLTRYLLYNPSLPSHCSHSFLLFQPEMDAFVFPRLNCWHNVIRLGLLIRLLDFKFWFWGRFYLFAQLNWRCGLVLCLKGWALLIVRKTFLWACFCCHWQH